jgi:beta-1,4-mannosyltransferase
MFGCGLPVLAKRFAAIDELVEDNVNGMLFDSAAELSSKIVLIAEGHPRNKVNI